MPSVSRPATPSLQPVGGSPQPAGRPRTSARLANLAVSASRGSCWVSIRFGSADGEVLFEGILESGQAKRVKGERLWLRLGTPANVDVRVNGTPARRLPAGTGDLVATRTGIAPAASA